MARHYPIVLSTVTYKSHTPLPDRSLLSRSDAPTFLSSEVPIHSFSGITQYRSLQSGARSRDHSIHLPSSYDAIKAYPRTCWASTARAAWAFSLRQIRAEWEQVQCGGVFGASIHSLDSIVSHPLHPYVDSASFTILSILFHQIPSYLDFTFVVGCTYG